MEQINKDQLAFVLDCMLGDDDDILSAVLQDSDQEEQLIMELYYKQEKRKKKSVNTNDFMETIASYSEKKFRKHFRVKKSLFKNLIEKFESGEVYKGLRPDKRCCASKHIAVFLWFAGHEMCSFRELGKRFDLSFSTASLIVERVTKFFSDLSATAINWPSDEQKQQSNIFFENKFGFSKAIGCIGVTNIVVEQPYECKKDYVDRNGNSSVCLQAICNEEKKFIDIFVGLPGSSQESWVYQNSPAYQILNNECGDYYVLGNSSYPSSKNLVTPYRDNGHMTSVQKNFNAKLNSSRLAIEHTFDMLIQRFPQLRCCKLRDMSKICHFVRACCVLHNITDENDFDFKLSSIPKAATEEYAERGEISRGNSVRDAICREIQLTESLPPEVINENQMEILVSYMEANLDLAQGICTNTQSKRWRRLSTALNSYEPPVHRWETWVKVWTNFKFKIKKKKAENTLKMKSTVGGPSKLHKFSQFEERVIDLLELSAYMYPSVPEDDDNMDIKVETPDHVEMNTCAVPLEPEEDEDYEIDIKVETTDLLEMNAPVDPLVPEDNDYKMDIKVETTQLLEVNTHVAPSFPEDDENEIDIKVEATDELAVNASVDPLVPEDEDNKINIKVETPESI